MYDLFFDCQNLIDIDLSNFETDNLKNMSNMFYNCSKIEKLDLSNFDTRRVTNMSGLFYGCEELTSLNLFYPNANDEKNLINLIYSMILNYHPKLNNSLNLLLLQHYVLLKAQLKNFLNRD